MSPEFFIPPVPQRCPLEDGLQVQRNHMGVGRVRQLGTGLTQPRRWQVGQETYGQVGVMVGGRFNRACLEEDFFKRKQLQEYGIKAMTI